MSCWGSHHPVDQSLISILILLRAQQVLIHSRKSTIQDGIRFGCVHSNSAKETAPRRSSAEGNLWEDKGTSHEGKQRRSHSSSSHCRRWHSWVSVSKAIWGSWLSWIAGNIEEERREPSWQLIRKIWSECILEYSSAWLSVLKLVFKTIYDAHCWFEKASSSRKKEAKILESEKDSKQKAEPTSLCFLIYCFGDGCSSEHIMKSLFKIRTLAFTGESAKANERAIT